MNFLAFLPSVLLKSFAKRGPIPGRFTQILSMVSLSPLLISLIATIDAYAKFIVGCSSSTAPFSHLLIASLILIPELVPYMHLHPLN